MVKTVTKYQQTATNLITTAKCVTHMGSDVYPECTSEECDRVLKKADTTKMKARVADRLLFRHWVEWRNRKRLSRFCHFQHWRDRPRRHAWGFRFAALWCGKRNRLRIFTRWHRGIASVRNPDKIEAISTNSDIYVTPVNGGAAKNITVTNKGYDASPIYAANSKSLLFRSQATAAFEAKLVADNAL